MRYKCCVVAAQIMPDVWLEDASNPSIQNSQLEYLECTSNVHFECYRNGPQ